MGATRAELMSNRPKIACEAAWPTAEVSFMSPDFATTIVHGVKPRDPDFAAKPAFKLLAYYGDDRTTPGRREGRYEYFDLMDVSDEEWEQCVPISLRLVHLLIRFCVSQNEGHRSTI